MAKVLKTLRNNWKKSTFAAIVAGFGINYAHTKSLDFLMMRRFCEEADASGNKPLPMVAKPKHITIILNPTASYKKAVKKFENFAKPILNLAGFLVNVVQTERISEARDLTGIIEKTNVIGVVGGDGTLMEVITGLLRREDAESVIQRFPIALIPVGSHNVFAKILLNKPNARDSELSAEAAIVVVRHKITPQDVIEIQAIEEDIPEIYSPVIEENAQIVQEPSLAEEVDLNIVGSEPAPEVDLSNVDSEPAPEEHTINEVKIPEAEVKNEKNKDTEEVQEKITRKPIYAMSGVIMGQFREANIIKDSMPGFFGETFSTFWSLIRSSSLPNFKAEIRYIPACENCAVCNFEEKPVEVQPGMNIFSRIFSIFRRPAVYAEETDLPLEVEETTNTICGQWATMTIDTPEFNIRRKGNGLLEMEIGSNETRGFTFITEGLRRLKNQEPALEKRVMFREAEITPISSPEFLSIDNEEFEVKPLKVKLLRKKVYFFSN